MQKKRNQRKHADCIFSTKNHSRFPKARKLASSACSNSPRFLTENFPDFLNAPKMRSEKAAHNTEFLVNLPLSVSPMGGEIKRGSNEQSDVVSNLRPHWSSVKRLRGFHVKSAAPIRAPKGVVLRRLVKSEAILAAEVQSAAFLGSFFSLRKRMNRSSTAASRINPIHK